MHNRAFVSSSGSRDGSSSGEMRDINVAPVEGKLWSTLSDSSAQRRKYLLGMHVFRWLLLSRMVDKSNETQIKAWEKDAQKDTEVILYASLPFTSLGTFQRNQYSCIFSLLFPASMWQHDSVFISVSSFYYVFLFSASYNLQRMSQLW